MHKRQSWRRAIGALAVCAMLWAFAVAPAAASGGSASSIADPITPGQVILRLQNTADLQAVATQYQLDPTPLDQLTIAPLYLMRITDGASPEVRAAALAADPRVAYAEVDVVGSSAEDQSQSSWASGGSAATYQGQWAPTLIRLPQAFTVTRGGGVTVAVLDSGVDFTHPALAGHLINGFDFVDNDADPSEVGVAGIDRAYGHGTFVTGLVALAAPEARIMPVRVLDPNGLSDVWRLSKAMVWAATYGADVINLSLGTYTHTHIANELISTITGNGRGVVVVAAAGNAGSNVPQFPAAEGGARVLSVGASTPSDTLATFSDYGSWVRVAAPGVSLWSTVPGGQFAAWNGTSMASGLAAGQAALVRAVYPKLNAQNVISRIASTSAKVGGAVPLRIDAAASVGAF
jgi:subtilisin family serine protease